MKCKVCGGTGTSNTCVNGTFKPCTFCDGTGEFDPNEVDRFNAVDVIKVMEMVKKPQTNEEWFDTLSTKEKAEWLDKVAEDCCQLCDEERREFCNKCIANDCEFENAEKWEMWLKQPHKPFS